MSGKVGGWVGGEYDGTTVYERHARMGEGLLAVASAVATEGGWVVQVRAPGSLVWRTVARGGIDEADVAFDVADEALAAAGWDA